MRKCIRFFDGRALGMEFEQVIKLCVKILLLRN